MTINTKYERAVETLTPLEKQVMVHKGTERPFTGTLWDATELGVYSCKLCNANLFHSQDKFSCSCGWPSFDTCIGKSVVEQPDADGSRIEVLCAECNAHLGHVFRGEGLTEKNIRYCINSVCLVFTPETTLQQNDADKENTEGVALDVAVFAAGCFWGIEDFFAHQHGVRQVVSGYTGGDMPNLTYHDVCTGTTGHAEAVKITYDPAFISYETLARMFFNIHDPTQHNRQGPDVGTQYRSAIFYSNNEQHQVAAQLISKLLTKGYNIETEVAPLGEFYPAEDYHQQYNRKHGKVGAYSISIDKFETPFQPRFFTKLW